MLLLAPTPSGALHQVANLENPLCTSSGKGSIGLIFHILRPLTGLIDIISPLRYVSDRLRFPFKNLTPDMSIQIISIRIPDLTHPYK